MAVEAGSMPPAFFTAVRSSVDDTLRQESFTLDLLPEQVPALLGELARWGRHHRHRGGRA